MSQWDPQAHGPELDELKKFLQIKSSSSREYFHLIGGYQSLDRLLVYV